MPSTKPARPDIRFAVTITESQRFGGDTQYRHFAARAYVLAPGRYSADHAIELHSPDSYEIERDDATMALAGLEITAQSDNDHMKRPGDEWYAWTVQYDRHRIELRDAKAILPVLRRIDRRMTKLTAELGRPATLAQFCAYAVTAVTAGRQPFMRHVPDGEDYEGHGYRSMDASALDYHLMADATEWRERNGVKLND
jgi:hypothetical protein